MYTIVWLAVTRINVIRLSVIACWYFETNLSLKLNQFLCAVFCTETLGIGQSMGNCQKQLIFEENYFAVINEVWVLYKCVEKIHFQSCFSYTVK